MELSAREIADATAGSLTGDVDARASGFAIDSRRLRPGEGFVAVRAERDGHDFIGHAFERGAALALVERDIDLPGPGVASVRVGSSMTALQALARLARDRLDHAVFVGITGSAGKTATKDLAAAAIGRVRTVHASQESFNNEAGVPLTLLAAPIGADVVVTEMGARAAGNITELAELTRPRIGVVTHVGLAHAGLLGGRAGVARVKGELLEALPPSGVAVLNAECDATPGLAARTSARVVLVGRGAGADLRASEIAFDDELRPRFVLDTPMGRADVRLRLRGDHQVENAAQAVAVALEVGVPLDAAVAGLADAEAAAHRMELARTPDGALVINDAYNSSPTSAAAAVRSLARLPVAGRRIAVLGEMLELGEHSDDEHAALGALAASEGLDELIAVGERARPIGDGAKGAAIAVHTCDDADSALRMLDDLLEPGDAVLVKASRAAGLERIAAALLQQKGVRA